MSFRRLLHRHTEKSPVGIIMMARCSRLCGFLHRHKERLQGLGFLAAASQEGDCFTSLRDESAAKGPLWGRELVARPRRVGGFIGTARGPEQRRLDERILTGWMDE